MYHCSYDVAVRARRITESTSMKMTLKRAWIGHVYPKHSGCVDNLGGSVQLVIKYDGGIAVEFTVFRGLWKIIMEDRLEECNTAEYGE